MCAEQKLHKGQVDIDAALVRRLVAEQFPQWTDLPLERFASGGTVNAIYRLGDDMYARLPMTKEWAWSIDNEVKRLPWLRPLIPFDIPEVLGRGTPGAGYPFAWAVFRWIEGEIWDLAGMRDDREPVLDYAAVVGALRRIDPGDFRPRGMAALSLRDLDGPIRDATHAARDLVDEPAVLAAWQQAVALPSFDGPYSWVHSDISADNLLMRDGRLSAVIDWGSVHVGDPAHDITPVWGMFPSEQRAVFRDALAIDDATWARARAFALRSVMGMDYYRETQPERTRACVRTIEAVLADLESDDCTALS